ncbi:MAG: lamin tail domain-containing protein [Prolixibacteraceae bacterium]|jgi:hypothetical protein|nr:lamin tail domain-containing protein [Prolixibacteraceae bacterium]
MPRIILFIPLFFTLTLSKTPKAQIIYTESFTVPDKGFWADSTGRVISDLNDVAWSMDIGNAVFEDENDYAKTVGTAGGRFEVLDSDGEITWASDKIDISKFDLINISLRASETGSSSVEEKKYLKAFYELDNDILSFSPIEKVAGNWGETTLEQKSISGNSLRLIVKMNSSYANDKVILDDISIEAIDESSLEPSAVQISAAPAFSFPGITFNVEAFVINGNDERLTAPNTQLILSIGGKTHLSEPDSTGIFQWEISATTPGEHLIEIESSDYPIPVVGQLITIYDPKDVVSYVDFEDSTSLQGFEYLENWEINSTAPIDGNKSLQHKPDTIINSDSVIYRSYESVGNHDDELLISFMLKNGNWDPSASNSFYVVIEPITDTIETTLAIGVNAKGSTDLVSVWTYQNGAADVLLAETNFDWNEEQTATINISRKQGGDWTLNVFDTQKGIYSETSFCYHNLLEIYKLKLIYNYTSTRAGQLWFDNLLIHSKNSPPSVLSARSINPEQFEITFTEPIDTISLTADNFLVSSPDGHKFLVQSIKVSNANTIQLFTGHVNSSTVLMVTAQNICDLKGLCTKNSTTTFLNVLNAEYGDVVINEIMADPYPPQQLPDAEYIEIFNQSDKNILLFNWGLSVRNNFRTISDSIIITPQQHLILCKPDYFEEFSKYGLTYGLNRFPSLLNSGAEIGLYASNKQTIDQITYSDSWYYNVEKDDGGFSLERIDANRFCGQSSNWSVSENNSGGTPGFENSIARENTDTVPPALISYIIKKTNRIELELSEAIDTSNFSAKNIEFEPFEITSLTTKNNIIAIDFTAALTNKRTYSLTVSNITDECGNIAMPINCTFLINLPEAGDILINELLFNPIDNGSDFIELYNHSDYPVYLSTMYFATRDNLLALKSINRFSKYSDTLKPASYCVVTTDTTNINEQYMVDKNSLLIQASKLPAMYNTEGRIVLLNDSIEVIDEVYYHESMHCKWMAGFDGVSLERVSFDVTTNTEGNWQSASSLTGFATPGGKNSQQKTDKSHLEIVVELESDVLSPNGDNYNDELTIGISGDATGYLINLFVYDTQGNEKKRLLNNALSGTKNEVVYDLRDNNNLLLRTGTYILYTEMIHTDKKTFTHKKAFHITQ